MHSAPYAACALALAWDFLAKSCLDDHLIVKKNENMRVPVWKNMKKVILSEGIDGRSITFVQLKSVLEVLLGIHLANY